MDSRVVMSRMDYEIIKRVYECALSIGLSDEELSFLMGKRNKYFFDLLDPTEKDKLKTEQLDILPAILGIAIRDLVPNDVAAGEDVIIHASRSVTPLKVIYKHYVVFSNGSRGPVITWTKKLVKGLRKKVNVELHQRVLDLLESGYFNERRNALDLLLVLRGNGLLFSPAELQKSLAVLMNRKGGRHALLACQSENSRYFYEQNSQQLR